MKILGLPQEYAVYILVAIVILQQLSLLGLFLLTRRHTRRLNNQTKIMRQVKGLASMAYNKAKQTQVYVGSLLQPGEGSDEDENNFETEEPEAVSH